MVDKYLLREILGNESVDSDGAILDGKVCYYVVYGAGDEEYEMWESISVSEFFDKCKAIKRVDDLNMNVEEGKGLARCCERCVYYSSMNESSGLCENIKLPELGVNKDFGCNYFKGIK